MRNRTDHISACIIDLLPHEAQRVNGIAQATVLVIYVVFDFVLLRPREQSGQLLLRHLLRQSGQIHRVCECLSHENSSLAITIEVDH
ncbi:hypothetical protein WJ42_06125 [Burkholderia cepacia]|nr:hypothetical protein WJ42_06125 [Burkholderia cepacia]KWC66919.1 hypothetical protein WL55_19240 [Burkholderia cepacia]